MRQVPFPKSMKLLRAPKLKMGNTGSMAALLCCPVAAGMTPEVAPLGRGKITADRLF